MESLALDIELFRDEETAKVVEESQKKRFAPDQTLVAQAVRLNKERRESLFIFHFLSLYRSFLRNAPLLSEEFALNQLRKQKNAIDKQVGEKMKVYHAFLCLVSFALFFLLIIFISQL